MMLAVPLDEDWHVHSTFSDGASTLAENVEAARAAGLRRICLTDHVRADTSWLGDYVAEVAALRGSGPDLVTGVEAKVLDADGRLDLPGGLDGVEVVLIADHQFPAAGGPVLPAQMRAQIAQGTVAARDVAGAVANATAAALGRVTPASRSLRGRDQVSRPVGTGHHDQGSRAACAGWPGDRGVPHPARLRSQQLVADLAVHIGAEPAAHLVEQPLAPGRYVSGGALVEVQPGHVLTEPDGLGPPAPGLAART